MKKVGAKPRKKSGKKGTRGGCDSLSTVAVWSNFLGRVAQKTKKSWSKGCGNDT